MLKICCTNAELTVKLVNVKPNFTAEDIEKWMTLFFKEIPFEHAITGPNENEAFLHLRTREESCDFFNKYNGCCLGMHKDMLITYSTYSDNEPVNYDLTPPHHH